VNASNRPVTERAEITEESIKEILAKYPIYSKPPQKVAGSNFNEIEPHCGVKV